MSEKMTTITIPGACGMSFYGDKPLSECIEEYKKYAAHELEQAQRVLAAPDSAFHVYTHRGIHVQKNKVVLQGGSR